jgi:hypothetical protein
MKMRSSVECNRLNKRDPMNSEALRVMKRSEPRTLGQIRKHYEIERTLVGKLRSATKEERRYHLAVGPEVRASC